MGNLARWNHDGRVEIMGRKDSQTKIRGQRIDLEEIEHHIALDPLIGHVIVCVPGAGRLTQKLVGLLTPNGFMDGDDDGPVPVAQRCGLVVIKRHASLINQLAEIRFPTGTNPTYAHGSHPLGPFEVNLFTAVWGSQPPPASSVARKPGSRNIRAGRDAVSGSSRYSTTFI